MNSFYYIQGLGDAHTNARVGVIHTPHGDIETPAFVPVGTQASVKSLTPEEIAEVGTRLFFVNTYHMCLRPGFEVIKKAHGLHRFMGWDGPIITDSGGFQVFSLGRKKYTTSIQKSTIDSGNQSVKEDQNDTPTLVRITEDGVEFRSHWDGSLHTFTPESSMQYQWDLGSDIHIAFDDCTPYPVTKKQAQKSMERTHRWAERSLTEHTRLSTIHDPQSTIYPYQALYGSIQGSVYKDLREESAKFITSLPFDGYAIGGVAVGESKKEMKDVLEWVTPLFPSDKPRHILGVGEIDDIFTLVEHGIDTFDCVQPTRLARMGRVFIHPHTHSPHTSPTTYGSNFEFDVMKAECAEDFYPIDSDCHCYTCTHFTRAYLHHLFKVRELLAYRLATIHNIAFINTLVSNIRLAIKDHSFVALKKEWGMESMSCE